MLCQWVYWFLAYPFSFCNAEYEVGMSDAGHNIQFLLHWLDLISGFWLMLLYPVVVEVVHFLIIFSSSICNRSRLCLFLGLLVLWLRLTAHIVILLLWRMYAPVNNCNLIGSLWRSPFDLQLIFNIPVGCSFPFSKFSQLGYGRIVWYRLCNWLAPMFVNFSFHRWCPYRLLWRIV